MSAALQSAARELRILVAEPSRTLASLIRAALAELGAEIELAPDGAQALQLARQRTPDLLIADQGLPGLDGYALAHALKQLAGSRQVTTLLLVPEYATPDPERLAYVGIQDVLAKPFERAVLLERARSLLGLPDRAPLGYRAGHELAPAPGPLAGGVGAPASAQYRRPEEPPSPERARATPDPASPFAGRASEATALAEIEERLGARLGTLVNERLPALIDGALARLLPTTVLAVTERVVAERVPAAVDGAAQRALAEVATPTRIDKVVSEVASLSVERAVEQGLEPLVAAAVDAAVGRSVAEAAKEIRARVEGELLARLDRFVKDELTVRLNAHAEQIVWKVVPAIAEDLVKEEIKRLTAE